MFDADSIFEQVKTREAGLAGAKNDPVLVRLWDGDWNLFAEVVDYYDLEFTFKNMDAGTGQLTLPIDHPVAKAMTNFEDWPTKSMYGTFDKDGARWSGRIVSQVVKVDYKGERHLQLNLIHDYMKLKELLVWANPFLPAGVQFPKAWMLFGPSRWVVATTLFVNLLRKNNSLWMLPDDPMNFSQWFDLDMTNWNMVVKPVSFATDESLPAVVSSRFKYFHDCVRDVCLDAQLTIDCRRYLPGDPPPIEGRNLRYGCLVFDVQDRAGWNRETSFGGSLISGLVRLFSAVSADGIGSDRRTVPRVEFPSEYYQAGFRGSLPEAPWVVLEHGEYTGMESTEFEYTPPGPSQFVTGGSSMPGVNEALKAAVIGVGGLIGAIFNYSALGSVANAVLEPLYTDVFLAFMARKHHARIREQGWDYPFEQWADGADKAYTLSALSTMRKAFHDTRERFAVRVKMNNGAPYWVGPRGVGDFFVGDRVAVHALGMPENVLYVDQVSELKYSVSADDEGWDISVGVPELDSGVSYLGRLLEETRKGLKELGVW